MAMTLLPRKHRLRLLLGCGCLLYFLANVERVAIPGAIFDALQHDLSLEAPQVTALGSSFMYIYAFNQLIVGFLVGRYGGRRVIAVGGILFAFGALLFPLSHDPWMLYFSRGLTGFGASSIYLALVSETIRAFRRNYAIMISVMIMIGYAGGVMANAPFVAGAALLGWRGLLVLIAIIAFLGYLAFVFTGFTLKPPPVRLHAGGAAHYFKLWKSPNNAALFLFGGLNFGLFYVLQTVIGKKFLEDFCHFSGSSAAWVLSLMGLISGISGFGIVVLSRLSGNRRRIFCLIPGAVCLLLWGALTLLVCRGEGSDWAAVGFCVLALTSSTSAILIPLLHETNLPAAADQAVGMLNFSCYFFVAVFGNLAGFLLNLYPPGKVDGISLYTRDSYLAAFSVFSLFSIIVFICSLKIRERKPAS